MTDPSTCPCCGGPTGARRRPTSRTVVYACGLTALAALALIVIRTTSDPGGVGPPPGWSDVVAADAGFRSYFPGELRRGVAGFPDAPGHTVRYYGSRALDEPTVQVFVHDPPAGAATPTTPEEWDAAAPQFLRSLRVNRNWRVLDKRPVVQAGRPALEVRVKTAWVAPTTAAPAATESGTAVASADGPPAEWWPSWVVYRLVPDGRRLYVVWVEQQGQAPDPRVLETVWASFALC